MRVTVHKTLKMYVGGAFIRSESGRVLTTRSDDGGVVNVPHASRKDLRNTVGKARAAAAGWATRSAFNRGQILYRLAEMMDGRGLSAAAVDRAVHYAGWTDKITAILASLNPVAQAYVNYSRIRPLGVVVAVPHSDDGLVGLVDALCAPLVMGDAVAVLVDTTVAERAVALAECLATSDMPGGIANILTGEVGEVLHVANRHDDVDGLLLFDGAISTELTRDCELEGARVMRRIARAPRGRPLTPLEMAHLAEVQTVWMSAGGEIPGGGVAY
jgi:acyl-CoA reductase-like NAD-dependent aldehyde dehydrogenase